MSNNKDNKQQPVHYPLINYDECKGCGRCVTACPKKCLAFRDELNNRGTKCVDYSGEGCIGCAICFYNCPEPFAIEIHTVKKDSEA